MNGIQETVALLCLFSVCCFLTAMFAATLGMVEHAKLFAALTFGILCLLLIIAIIDTVWALIERAP